MWFIYAIVSLITFGLSAFLMKYNSFKKWSLYEMLFGIYISGASCFFVWAIILDELQFNWILLLSGLLIGVGSSFGNLMFMKALDYGPASLTSPLVNVSVIFIVFMSIFIYGEFLGVLEWAGILLVIIATSLLPFDPSETLSIRNKKWYIYLLLATLLFFLRNGGLKVTEELTLNNTSILFYGYLFGVICYGAWIILRKNKVESKIECRYGLYCGLITGVFSFSGMLFYSLALVSGPASIVSPMFAAHSLIVVILSVIMFRERLSKIQWIALVGIFAGIILIRI